MNVSETYMVPPTLVALFQQCARILRHTVYFAVHIRSNLTSGVPPGGIFGDWELCTRMWMAGYQVTVVGP